MNGILVLNHTHSYRHESAEEAALAESRLALAPHYTVVRRAIGYLSGLMLLYRGAKGFKPDSIFEAAERLDEEFRELADRLRSLEVPAALVPTRQTVMTSAMLVSSAAAMIKKSLTIGGGGLDVAEQSLELLRRAHRLLMPIHDQHSGMMMVDFNHACCHCTGSEIEQTT